MKSEIHISQLLGKLAGIPAFNIGLPPALNPACQKMARCPENICSECYSKQAGKYRPNIVKAHCRNHYTPIPEFRHVKTNYLYVRLNSHVEIVNTEDLLKMRVLCHNNPETRFVLWTKRFRLITSFFYRNTKPENLSLIYSWPKLETDNQNKGFTGRIFRWIKRENERGLWDAVFVVSREGEFNCGKRACMDCLACYRLDHSGDIQVIREKLK